VTPRLTIALVTFNSRDHVELLLDAIDAFTCAPHDLIVVDNGSTDGMLDLLRARAGRPGFALVENGRNLRCAAATNQALALTRTDYLVYLCARHALVTSPGWDVALVGYMDAHRDVPLAGDVWNPYGFTLPSRRYANGWTPERHGRENLLHVQGGAWVARTAVLREIGGFNAEEYPHSGMDVELSYVLVSLGLPLGQCRAIAAPPSPIEPAIGAGLAVVHPASEAARAGVHRRLTAALV
jgi:GT2 family glycosyltransferase